jgi:hypothetical protein
MNTQSIYTVTSILTSYLCYVDRRRIIAHPMDGGAACWWTGCRPVGSIVVTVDIRCVLRFASRY